jgi:hypothetical protein
MVPTKKKIVRLVRNFTVGEAFAYHEGQIRALVQFIIAAVAGSDPRNLEKCIDLAMHVQSVCKRDRDRREHFRLGVQDFLYHLDRTVSDFEKALEIPSARKEGELLIRALPKRKRKRSVNVVPFEGPPTDPSKA